MPVIRIREQYPVDAAGHNVVVSFDHAEEYPVTVRDPFTPNEERALEWYFEDHLRFPFIREVQAQQAAISVSRYGEALFKQLFATPDLYARYREATRNGVGDLTIEFAGSSAFHPDFHRLHWEALKDPDNDRPLALDALMLRINTRPLPVRAPLRPSPTINVLVVTARPHGAHDVSYRTISRPLVESLRQANLRVQVDIVRPGTYQALTRHLEAVTEAHGAGYYHVIHFDVHGALARYDQVAREPEAAGYTFGRYGRPNLAPYEGYRAYLFLESSTQDDGDGKSDPVEANELAALLLKHQIPIAILNACQSAKQAAPSEPDSGPDSDTHARPHASTDAEPDVTAPDTSLGATLLQAGVQMVLAMGYSVTVSAAQLFMQTLYERLFASGQVSAAVRAARQELANRKSRRAYFNQQIDLEDWLLPVLYQNQPLTLAVRDFTDAERAAYDQRRESRFAPPVPTYGFLGRDLDILEIERRLLTDPDRNQALIQGMGGAGKTTLLRHLGWWWQTTGLVNHVWYFGYDESAWTRHRLLLAIGERLLGKERYQRELQPRDLDTQQDVLCQRLRAERHLIILDNLESITGTELAIQHTLPPDERQALHALLRDLSGGKTLVLLGSRSAEAWLASGTFGANRYALPGLDPEAASALADRVLIAAQATQYRKDPDLVRLLNLLDGFPLAIEVVLANLAHQTPAEVLAALQTGEVDDIDTPNEADRADRTRSILHSIDYSHSNLAPGDQTLLLCLAPFTSVVFRPMLDDYVAALQRQPALAGLPFDRWEDVLREAARWGLLTPDAAIPNFLRLQPIFPYFLRERLATPERAPLRQAIEAAFREYYTQLSGGLLSLVRSKEPDERQIGMALMRYEFENILHALHLALAAPASLFNLYGALTNYLDATHDEPLGLAIGRDALQRLSAHPFDALASNLQIEYIRLQSNLAGRYRKLRLYAEATDLYKQALARLDDMPGVQDNARAILRAIILHNLGVVAQEQRQWVAAEDYYQRALALKVEFNARYEQASTLHQLGMVAQEQRQWVAAEDYYQRALALYIEFNARYEQAGTLHNLGVVAQEQRQWVAARDYFLRALAIYAATDDPQSQYNLAIVLGSLARLWRTSADPTIPQEVASAFGINPGEAEAGLRSVLAPDDGAGAVGNGDSDDSDADSAVASAQDNTGAPDAAPDPALDAAPPPPALASVIPSVAATSAIPDSPVPSPQPTGASAVIHPPALGPGAGTGTVLAALPILAATPATPHDASAFLPHPLLVGLTTAALLLMTGCYSIILSDHQSVFWPVALASWLLALSATVIACALAARRRRWGWLVTILLLAIVPGPVLPGLGALLFGLFAGAEPRANDIAPEKRQL